MIVAVASDRGMVSEHFGHCEAFVLFTTKEGTITEEKSLPNPGHKPGFLPNYLNEQGIKTIISGGMGGGAIDIFNEHNIEVIVGATGPAKEAVEKYLSGQLKSTGSVCHQHAHADECSQH